MTTQWKITIAWDGTNYVDEGSLSKSPFTSRRGREYILSDTSLEDMQTGECSFTLPNIAGRFDPYNTSGALYPNVKPGRKCKINAYDLVAPANHYIFTGIVSDIQPVSGENRVSISVQDGLQWLADQDITVAEMDNTTIHLALDAVLTAAAYPFATAIDACSQPIYIFDPSPVSGTGKTATRQSSKALDVIRDLARASLGTFFISGDGTATFYSLGTSGGATYDLDQEDLAKEIPIQMPWTNVRNDVQVTATRRGMLALSPIWTGGGMALTDNTAINIDITFDASASVYVPAVRLIANTAADGSGTDISSHVAASISLLTPTSCHLYIFPSDDGYLLNLEVWGQKYIETPYVSKAYDSASADIVTGYGPKLFTLESPWLQDRGYADAFAALILAQLKDPSRNPIIYIKGYPATQYRYELMDNIHLTAAALGIDDTFRVGGRVDEWQDTENGQSVLTTLYLQKVIWSDSAITPDPYSPSVPPTVSPQTPPVFPPGGSEPTGKTTQILIIVSTGLIDGDPAVESDLDLYDGTGIGRWENYNTEANSWVDNTGDIVFPETGIYKITIDAHTQLEAMALETTNISPFTNAKEYYLPPFVYDMELVGYYSGPANIQVNASANWSQTYTAHPGGAWYYVDASASNTSFVDCGNVANKLHFKLTCGGGYSQNQGLSFTLTITQLLDASALVGATGPAGATGAAGAAGAEGPEGSPGPGLPTGGAIGEVPEKTNTGDFAVNWSTRIKRNGSTVNHHLAQWNGNDADSLEDGGVIPAGLPTSGTTGQVLKKYSNTNYDVYWAADDTGTPGVTRSGSTADGHLAVWNGTDADSIKDGGEVPSGGSGVSSGTSFPGSPTSGDLYFRTDLNLLCTWNGTYWLTVEQYACQMPAQLNVSGGVNVFASIRGDYFAYITKVHYSFAYGSANNGSNYWNTVLAAYQNYNGGYTYAVKTQNTSTYSAYDATELDVTINAKAVDGSSPTTKLPFMQLSISAINSPSNLNICAVTIYYRLIIT